MVKSLPAFRVYASTLTSFDSLPIDIGLGEVHIVLTFARDYDEEGNYQVGNFFSYFDETKVTPKAIRDFKNRAATMNLRVKFFLSIGGRDSRFPFAVTPADEATWIRNATKSLKELVSKYHIDGIDVYYEHINQDAMPQFGKAIPEVIENLKKKNDNATFKIAASITVSAPLSTNYFNLYEANEKLFDYVVYQTHTELDPICSSCDLTLVIAKLPYPKEKTLAGYSDVLSRDWSKVSPTVFLFAVPGLLDLGLYAISKWIVTDHNPEA